MEINKEIEKNINKNLLQCKDMIINELVSIFGKEYTEQIKASFDNIIIMYTTKKETIDELFNNRDSLDDETISALDYYDDKIFDNVDMLNDTETIIGFLNLTGKKDREEMSKLLLKDRDSKTFKYANQKYSCIKLDIFDIHANEDYILEFINLLVFDNDLSEKLSTKYGEEFKNEYINLRSDIANVVSKIISESLAKKQVFLFNQNKDYDYWQGRTEMLTYTFEGDLTLALTDPIKFIDKIGVDNLTTFINNFERLIENDSIEEIDKEEFKQNIDTIKSICHHEEQVIMNTPLIEQTIKELKEKKEQLKSFPKFDKENPEIASFQHIEHQEMPPLELNNTDKPKKHIKIEPFKLKSFNDFANNKKPTEQSQNNKTSFNDMVKTIFNVKEKTFQDIVDQDEKHKSR